MIKSPMNYTGGKYKLLPQLLPLFPKEIDMFIDLFTGGGNVAINVSAKNIIANDFMSQIIQIYNSFKTLGLDNTLIDINNNILKYNLNKQNKEGYLELRNFYNKTKNPIDLFTLICYSFNHSIRFNSKGEFNIAFGKDRSEFNKTIEKNLNEFVSAIKNINFTSMDFREVLNGFSFKQNDFVYADPPYLITVANYNENGGWTRMDEIQLLLELDNLNNNGIKFGLSNVLTHKGKTNDILLEWSKNYNVYHLDIDYGNSNYQTKDKITKSDEVYICNY